MDVFTSTAFSIDPEAGIIVTYLAFIMKGLPMKELTRSISNNVSPPHSSLYINPFFFICLLHNSMALAGNSAA